MSPPVVIVGGGLAAVRSAQALRSAGFDGELLMLSAERELPYDRPPLSKDYLLGKSAEQDIRLVSSAELEDLDVRVELGVTAVGLDCERHEIEIETGASIPYAQLVVATGAAPVRLPIFGDREGVGYLHDIDDARQLRDELAAQPRVGIVGGGFIGLEIASAARALGCEATVIEMAREPLAPVLGEELGAWIREWHEAQGVAFGLGAAVEEVLGAGRVERLLLANGGSLDVDLVVAGVGVRPSVGWLQTSGLKLHRGLACDTAGRTSDANVFGVGDATCRHHGGACRPSAHWTAVSAQAVATASALLGTLEQEPPPDDGYFWSDQHGKRLQFAGTMPANPELQVLAGGRGEDSFVVRCGSDGLDSAVLALASPREFVRASLELKRARAGGAPARAA